MMIARRILSFIALAVVPAVAIGQRQPNLNLAHYWGKTEGTLTFIKDNDAIVVDGNAGSYFFQWRIVNNGATTNDTIAVSDTIKVKTNWNTYKVAWAQAQFPNGMKQQDTVFITPAVNPITLPLPAGLTASQDSVVTQWCDSVYFISGDLANPAIEADPSDDTVCNTVFVTYWRTQIEEVVAGNGVILYPNPANGRLNVRYKEMRTVSSIRIFNAVGAISYSQAITDPDRGSGVVAMNVTALNSGLYLLCLETPGGTLTEKFYIQ